MKTIIEQTESPSTSDVIVHAFERAGLGKPPYRFTGLRENVLRFQDGTSKAGGCCDYCFTGIRDEYWLQSSDLKSFKVGCDCIAKSGDHGLVKVVQKHPTVVAAKRAKNYAKFLKTQSELDALLLNKSTEIASIPHPSRFKDRKTGIDLTLLDYAKWMRLNAGRSGISSALRIVKNKLGITR